MTLSDLTSKTPEELNSKLHHALGFRWSMPNEAWYRNGSYVGTKIPNYTGSYDAIMPEVRKLEDDNACDFDTYIWQIVNPTSHFKGSKGFKHVSFKVHSASPLHLTIALILTLHP